MTKIAMEALNNGNFGQRESLMPILRGILTAITALFVMFFLASFLLPEMNLAIGITIWIVSISVGFYAAYRDRPNP